VKPLTLLALLAWAVPAGHAQQPVAADYRSPCTVAFSFSQEELTGDLTKGPRADWKQQAAVDHREWFLPANRPRWGYWGPPARHYDPPAGLSRRSPQWLRERVIATGLRYVGYRYQHQHIPDWEAPADWPTAPSQTTPRGKGLDCSNFTSFVYNLALGIKPTSDVQQQAAMTEAPGPGRGRRTPARRIELPADHAAYPQVLRTGDLLFVKNRGGNISHVVLWVGAIGRSPDGLPLVLDSTGTGATDSRGVGIPDGIQLRPFKPTTWYFTQASHALRLLPDDP